MANNQALLHCMDNVDYHAALGYPAASLVMQFKSDAAEIHLIIYAGSPVGIFANAPNGSMVIDSTNHHTYTKSGTWGAVDGTWTVNS